jgi:hypothetical protein
LLGEILSVISNNLRRARETIAQSMIRRVLSPKVCSLEKKPGAIKITPEPEPLDCSFDEGVPDWPMHCSKGKVRGMNDPMVH